MAPDRGERPGDPKAREEVRERRRNPQQEDLLPLRRLAHAEEVHEVPVGGDEPLGRVHDHREEADQERDDRDALQAWPDPEDEDGRDDDDRRHLQDHQVGIEARANKRRKGEQEREREAERHRDPEPEEGSAARVQRRAPQRRPLVDERPGDGARGGQQEPLLGAHAHVDRVPDEDDHEAGHEREKAPERLGDGEPGPRVAHGVSRSTERRMPDTSPTSCW